MLRHRRRLHPLRHQAKHLDARELRHDLRQQLPSVTSSTRHSAARISDDASLRPRSISDRYGMLMREVSESSRSVAPRSVRNRRSTEPIACRINMPEA